ncbi:uncharacterized protein LOC114078399 [Solanum pennellii]|uniref:Uncharacterized protein LOC114078399 n=1 Tax=Solanum pennellii TaxID=28526 RepID=A0ABM1VH50_SOLPN|nr:uncharacterized protein LOC114078399 [Solanum pennellii]
MTNQAGQKRGARQEANDTSRIREFLRMDTPCFTGYITTEDPPNFIEEVKNIFEVMHSADTEQVDLVAYQLNNVARTWYDQWKEGRDEDAPHASWVEEEKLRDKEDFNNNRSKTRNESGQQKSSAYQSSFQQKQKGPSPSFSSAPAPKKKCETIARVLDLNLFILKVA